MATKRKSKEILKLKYLLVVPIILIMLTFTSIFGNTNNESNQEVKINSFDLNLLKNPQDTIYPTKNQSDFIKKTTYKGEKIYNPQDIDIPTHFETRISKRGKEGMEFLSDLIAFGIENTDKEKVNSFKAKDKGAIVTFIINKQGKIEAIDASSVKNKAFKEYAINIVKKLPKIIAGKHRGKPVYTRGVIYVSNYNSNYKRIKLPYSKVDQKPIYPSCENAVDKDKCFQQSVSKYIVQNFDKKMVSSLGLSHGVVRIIAQFSFNEYGNTLDVKVRAPHPKIEEHVRSIIAKMPQVIPAKQNGKNVVVKYVLPIKINIESGNTTISHNEIIDITESDEIEIIPFSVIDKIPVYPGCKGTQQELKKCMAHKIAKHLAKEFNVDLAQDLGLSVGKKRISVQFEIDKNGNIGDVRARAPHPKLRTEAIRIIKLLPKMKPGKQNGKAVNVRYNLPIVFNVEDDKVKSTENIGMINGRYQNVILNKKNLENNIIQSHNGNGFNEVVSFYLKVPGKPSLKINGNKFTKKAIKNIKNLQAGDVMIIFNIRLKNNTKNTSSITFNVSNNSINPNYLEGTINGNFGYLKMTKDKLIAGEIGALNYDTNNSNYQVVSFQLNINHQDILTINGNRLNNKAKELIFNLKEGDFVKIQNIQVEDANIHIEPITIKIK